MRIGAELTPGGSLQSMIEQNHAVEVRRSEFRTLSGEARDLYECSVSSLDEGEFEEATLALHRAAGLAPENARIRLAAGPLDCAPREGFSASA